MTGRARTGSTKAAIGPSLEGGRTLGPLLAETLEARRAAGRPCPKTELVIYAAPDGPRSNDAADTRAAAATPRTGAGALPREVAP